MALEYLTSENYEEQINQSNLPVIVDFYADWCGPCRMMAPVFEELSKEFKGKINFLKLDTEEEFEIANKFSIMGIPTLLIMHKGKEVARLVGFMPKDVLREKIKNTISKLK